MQRQIFRDTMTTAVVSILLTGVPAAIGGYLLCRSTGARIPPTWLAAYIVGVLALVGVTLALAARQATRTATRLGEPLARLAEQAERVGAGDARFDATESGITEIDRVGQVLKQSVSQLVASLSTERDFASDASHQLRTPLTALLMRLEEIAATDDLDVARDEATIAIEQVERLNGTVDELLARNRQGSQAKPAPVSLDTVLASVQREWHPAFGAQHRSIHVTGERGLKVLTTQVALSQVLATLVENSLAHGRGTVRVDARRSGPSVRVEVSDQGPGIDPSLAPHIFERSVSTKSTGLGLGLARSVAEKHGGRLELVSGQPAVFALFLSAAD